METINHKLELFFVNGKFLYKFIQWIHAQVLYTRYGFIECYGEVLTLVPDVLVQMYELDFLRIL